MCCLFGLIDTELRFTGKEKSKMFHALASASEARGTDATGVAYDYSRTLHIYKRPIPGHKLNFYLRNDTPLRHGPHPHDDPGTGIFWQGIFLRCNRNVCQNHCKSLFCRNVRLYGHLLC